MVLINFVVFANRAMAKNAVAFTMI
jgi:hypothetical protein